MHPKVAIITGSARGIGAAIARCLDAAGMRVVIHSKDSVTEGKAVANTCNTAFYHAADLTQKSACQGLVAATLERWGRIDILVNNVGHSVHIPFNDLEAATEELFHALFQVNVLSAWHMSLAAKAALTEAPDAAIVNISSVAGAQTLGSSIPYAVSKAALNHLTRLLATVLAPDIRVNAIAPGCIDTPREGDWSTLTDTYAQTTALGRLGKPEEIAQMVLSILHARYMTGEIITVDGGLTCSKTSCNTTPS